MQILKRLKINRTMLVSLVLLLVIGLINLYSALYNWGEEGKLNIFWSQIIWIVVGCFMMSFAAFVDYHLFQRLSYWIYGVVAVLLLAVVFFGVVVNGTKGWLRIGGLTLQPAEFSKLAYIFVASKYFSKNPYPDGMSILDILKAMLIVLPLFVLVMLQGDLGSSVFLLLLSTTFILFVGVKKKTLIALIILVLVGSSVFYIFFIKEYQRSRITNFLNPEADQKGSGYQVVQSKIAVGSGKIFGKGYLKGNINKLRYLPERHTDFIFPVLAEEWGFAGSSIIVLLYISLLMSCIDIAKKGRDRFASFLAIGVTAIFFWQISINLCGVLGLIPLTGIPLPFMSYGGSSMVALLISVGVIINVDRNRSRF